MWHSCARVVAIIICLWLGRATATAAANGTANRWTVVLLVLAFEVLAR